MSPIVAAFDLVAVPSVWYEAFGRTVVEALAMQVPVIASRIGGMAELFEDGVHGHYVPAGDRDALAAAIAALATDPAARRAMGRAGRAWVQERYAMERVAAEYARLYRELLAESGPDNSA
jgi:glycosyltransferase involved in cell wall biosynthesis